MADLSEQENRAQIREAKSKGKSSGFKLGVFATLVASIATTIALNKAGVNTSDKLTSAYDKTAAKVKETASSAKKKLDEKSFYTILYCALFIVSLISPFFASKAHFNASCEPWMPAMRCCPLRRLSRSWIT